MPTKIDKDDDKQPAEGTPVLKSEEVFRGRREVILDHDGVCYRLRITKRGKLILHK